MIELFKTIGSALVAACATLLTLYLKRRWEKQDKKDEQKETMEDKLDKMSNELSELTKAIEKISSEQAPLQAGLRELLYDRIKVLCKKYETEGRMREEEYKSLKRMWQVYHESLEGNGFLNSEMETIERLEKY